MSIGPAFISVGSNLKHVGLVIGGCNFVGYMASAAFETHKITDLVGVGSFVAAAVSLTLRNPALLTPTSVIPAAANVGVLGKCMQIGAVQVCTGTARVLIANGLVIIWGARLSTYLFNRVLKLGEDKRLDKFYKQPGESYLDRSKSFYPLKLSGFWIIQAAWGFLCCLPITLLNSVPISSTISRTFAYSTVGEMYAKNKLAAAFPLSMRLTGPLSILKWLPVAAGLTGIVMETVADYQKSAFRSDVANKGKWCDTGLWSLCRYPNYFGELVTWWSIYGLCAPALSVPLAVVSLASPLFVTFLITRVSGIPLLEATNDKKYEGNEDYSEYKRNTPLLVPNLFRFLNHSPSVPKKDQ